MPEEYYREALKRAQKEYRACVSRGASPCLPVMDDFVPGERAAGGANLGLAQIPMEFIVGTKSRGRENAFAANFMPLLDPKTEFAEKWRRLCAAHLEEGIREPVKVYEFMNRYYVEEGHKRVSVLKFFGSPVVTGNVVRVMPERTAETALYFEFTRFCRCSGVNFIEFSRPGSYAALQRLLGKTEDEPWTEEERRRFSAVWYHFRQAYEALDGEGTAAAAGDAMLTCIDIFGYPALLGMSAAEMKISLSRAREEIDLRQETPPIDVKLMPQEKKPGVIRRVLSGGETKPVRVAFVHDGHPSSSAWTWGHECGREYVQRVLEGRIVTTAYFDAMAQEPEHVIERAAEEGNTVIFTTSPRLLTASLRTAVKHPETTVFNCSLNTSHRYIRTYYARMYEVKFIIGAIAGALAGADTVGYMADYPIYGQIAAVNAFALGVQMVNPRARVALEWSSVGGGDAALARLTGRGIRLISSQDLVRMGRESSSSLGLSLLSGNERVELCKPLWQWGGYYEQLLRMVRDRSVQEEYVQSRRALNYYWGLSAGVVGLYCSDKLPPSVRKLADFLTDGIRNGSCEPFRGPLYTQNGRIRTAERGLTPGEIMGMDYLMENIDGAIPAYEELTELGKATVDMVGVTRASGAERR